MGYTRPSRGPSPYFTLISQCRLPQAACAIPRRRPQLAAWSLLVQAGETGINQAHSELLQLLHLNSFHLETCRSRLPD
ncbi:hypothetical protein RRG08_064488 [Elysia crispata]|uniref:Uncharacterized protein n=1 Tax=Elysia crispata TaxID=231223 RepID=A0AAE1AE47_9GAST|nr:hypothetical protein RRG08_064488 [Elysia crispata]